jgi:hypothetical protein
MQVSAYLKLSVAVAVATIGLKKAAWWWTGSVYLASDALEALVNLAGATFALAMVTVAARPPDEDHPFGHHKAEYFSSGLEGGLIIAAAGGIVWAAVRRLPKGMTVQGWSAFCATAHARRLRWSGCAKRAQSWFTAAPNSTASRPATPATSEAQGPLASTRTGPSARAWDASGACNACAHAVGFPIRGLAGGT